MSGESILILATTGVVILWIAIRTILDEREYRRVSKQSRRDQQRTYNWKEAQAQAKRDKMLSQIRRKHLSPQEIARRLEDVSASTGESPQLLMDKAALPEEIQTFVRKHLPPSAPNPGGIVESNHRVEWNAPRKVFPSNSWEVHWSGPAPGEVDNGVDLTEYIKTEPIINRPIFSDPTSGREWAQKINSTTRRSGRTKADQDLIDAFERMRKSVGQAPEALKEMGISAEEAMEQMKRFTEADMPKPITDIEIRTEDRYVETTTLGDPLPSYVKGKSQTVILDQDGDEVPLQLEEKLREVFSQRLVDEMELIDILGDYNVSIQVGFQGHFKRCPYPRDRKWACVCQPPTLFSEVFTYQCACCNEPVAHERHGLCDVCERHQYAEPSVAEEDHERVYTG